MGRVLVCLLAAGLSACALLQEPAKPDECWFLDDAPLAFSGFTTLSELGMGGPEGEFDDERVYAWITQERIDLWGGAELTQAVCTLTDDPALAARLGSAVGWNEYPVVNGMPDPGFERDD